ncbi:MAG: MFS transporter [Opitutales bacterium]
MSDAGAESKGAQSASAGPLPLGAFVWRFRYNYLFSVFNGMTWLIALGAPMVLLAESLGATPAQVNLCYNFVFLLLPVQVLATTLTPHLGFKRQMMLAWGARAFCLLVPLGIALSSPSAPAPGWMLWALIGSIFMFTLLRSLGTPVVLPWLQAMLPDGQRGRFFTTDQSFTALAGVGILLICAWLAQTLQGSYAAFAWQYGLALTGGLGALYCLRFWPDAPKPQMMPARSVLRELPRAVGAELPVRQILALMVVAGFVGSSFIPLTTYYLKVEAKLSTAMILVYSALQYVGVIGGSWVLRNLLDRFGSKPFFQLSLAAGLLLDIYWLVLVVSGSGTLLWFLPLAFVWAGVGGSQWAASTTRYLAQLGNYENRAILIAGITATAGVGNACFAYLWGLVVKSEDAVGQVGLDATWFAAFFAVGLLVRGGLFFAFGRLAEERPGSALRISNAGLIRPFRFFASMVNLVEPEPRKAKGRTHHKEVE